MTNIGTTLRQYRDPSRLTPAEQRLYDAISTHGSLGAAREALGLTVKTAGHTAQRIAEKLGLQSSSRALVAHILSQKLEAAE